MKRARRVAGLAARGALVAIIASGGALAKTAPKITPPPPAVPAAVATAPATAPAAPRPMSESIAAVVNDQIISTYDLAQRMRLLIASSGIQPTEQNLAQFQREALISLIDERLQIGELKHVEKEQKISIIATDAELDEELSNMAKGNNMSTDQFLGSLRAQGIEPGTLREQVRAAISWQRWIRGRYGSRLRVGEDQIKAAQQRQTAQASKAQYQLGEIFIDANRVGGAKPAMDGATQLVAQMQQGAPFAAVARQFSASATAASGGDAGWVSLGEMAPEVDAALEQMRPGQLSQPIAVRDGVYILYLRDKRSGAGATVVSLKQMAISLPQDAPASQVDAARAKLVDLKGKITGCGDVEAVAAKSSGVVAGDLGEAEIKDLSPAFRDAANALQPGQVSDPIRTNAGLHLLAVCGKRAGGAEEVTHDEVENRLIGQQLSMVSRRYMRDLRNSATIETR